MADTKIRLREATAQLRDDHRLIKKLFAAYDEIDEDDAIRAADLFDALRREIEIHARLEREVFYPAVRASENEDGARFVFEAFDAHLVAEGLLGELEALMPGEREFNAKLKELEDHILRHADEEEEAIFPIFLSLPPEDQEDVAERLAIRRREISGEE